MTKTTDVETGFAPLYEVVKHLSYSPTEAVGVTSDQNLCWLLSFIQRDDLAVMNERQERNAVAEFVLFWASQGASGRRPAPVRRRNLVEFAASMREGLKTLQSGQSWDVAAPPDLVAHTQPSGNRKPASYRLVTRSVSAGALWHAHLLLGRNFHRLGNCPRCGKWFLLRRRAKFCSPECGNAHHQQNFQDRQSAAERLTYRRASYVRRLLRTDRIVDGKQLSGHDAAALFIARLERRKPQEAARLLKQLDAETLAALHASKDHLLERNLEGEQMT